MKLLSPGDQAQLLRETTAQFWTHIVPIVKVAFFIHLVLVFVFSAMHLPLLAMSNVASVLAYVACLKAIRAGRYRLAGLLMSVEIILHALLTTYVLGWDSSFYFYLYCLIPIIAFSFQDARLLRWLLYIAILVVSAGGFALRKQLDINSGVPPHWIEVFGIVNVLAALGVLIHCTALSVRFTRSVQARLFHSANRDSLTNLYTRRRVMHEVGQLAGTVSSAIILLDIDHFKQINDRLGHERGDFILQRVAEAINSNVRSTDLASRWGGEEFLVLMPATPGPAAQVVAERILLRIREWVGQLSETPITVTATLAVSEIRDGESFQSALNRADQALYLGKQSGRNQVVLAD